MNNSPRVVTRFAPSPTGFLHIGNARTALFNWLYARHVGGKFLLRIEDTDRARSTQPAIDAIFDGLTWLGINWDEEPVFQYAHKDRHQEIAQGLLTSGKAYHCYLQGEELENERIQARKEGRRLASPWRDRDPDDAPDDIKPVIRLRAPLEGITTIDDLIQGQVQIPNSQLDDMILLRSDGNPTYMLSVVVDDHDSGVNHVIRGDDHLINAARQAQLSQALEWQRPAFAHMGLIHGPDGTKLSKRHGALGVDAYRDMGYLPEALRNYLARLGWSHGDDEIFSTEQAIEWFEIKDVGKAPSRIDFAKLESINGQYMRDMQETDIIAALEDYARLQGVVTFDDPSNERLKIVLPELLERSKTLRQLYDSSEFLLSNHEIFISPEDLQVFDPATRSHMGVVRDILSPMESWTEEDIADQLKSGLKDNNLKLGQVGPALRVALTGRKAAPGLFVILHALGKNLTLERLSAIPET